MEKPFFALSFGFLLLILLMQHAFAAQSGHIEVIPNSRDVQTSSQQFCANVSNTETDCFENKG